MKCYFYGYCLQDANGLSDDCITSFAIPDLGVYFRTRREGTRFECEYLALLTLLEFLNVNAESVHGQKFDILGDSAVIAYQLTNKMPAASRLLPYMRRVLEYRKKINFEVSWVPHALNRAAQPIAALPALKLKFNFDFALARRIVEQRSGSGFPTTSGGL
jgi:hypothetical protein